MYRKKFAVTLTGDWQDKLLAVCAKDETEARQRISQLIANHANQYPNITAWLALGQPLVEIPPRFFVIQLFAECQLWCEFADEKYGRVLASTTCDPANLSRLTEWVRTQIGAHPFDLQYLNGLLKQIA